MAETSGSTTRVLVAARLSRVTDKGKSRIERDDETAQKWATGREGCVLVATATDAGVSGSVSPWDRRGLGPWLKDPALVASYDEIVASTIDRVGRSARDLNDLKAWAEDNAKTLRILKPPLEWPVPEGIEGAPSRMMWALLGELAEIELQITKQRYADVQQNLKDHGALVGKPPWGYLIVGDKGAKTLAPDPRFVPYLRGMVERALRDDTLLSICRWLDAEGVPTVHGDKWSPVSVSNLLRNPALKGRRYEDGRVVLKFDSLLTSTQFAQLQAALDSRPTRRGPVSSDTALLTGVIVCEKCGGPMYRSNSTTKRKDGTKNVCTYYRCKGSDKEPSTCRNSVPLDEIESWLDRYFTPTPNPDVRPLTGAFGDIEIIETITMAGDDHKAEVAEIEAEIRGLDLDAEDYLERLQALRAERARLLALPTEPTQVIERPTGQVVGEVWKTLDTEGKRNYLLATGVKVRVFSNAQFRADGKGDLRYLWPGRAPNKIMGTLQGLVAIQPPHDEHDPLWSEPPALPWLADT